MSLTKFNESVTNHQSLPDKPTQSSTELKILFDKAGVDIKKYLNQILTEELDSKESNLRQLIQQNTSNISNMLNTVYPIGSIYMSVNNTNPSTIFGGTWVSWGAGKVPVGVNANETEFNSVEKTGGAKTHTLTTAQIPSHNHSLNNHTHSIPQLSGSTSTKELIGRMYDMAVQSSGAGVKANGILSQINPMGGFVAYAFESKQSGSADFTDIIELNASHNHSITTNSNTTGQASGNTGNTGSGQAHNNLQPYITCYMWKRTA